MVVKNVGYTCELHRRLRKDSVRCGDRRVVVLLNKYVDAEIQRKRNTGEQRMRS